MLSLFRGWQVGYSDEYGQCHVHFDTTAVGVTYIRTVSLNRPAASLAAGRATHENTATTAAADILKTKTPTAEIRRQNDTRLFAKVAFYVCVFFFHSAELVHCQSTYRSSKLSQLLSGS